MKKWFALWAVLIVFGCGKYSQGSESESATAPAQSRRPRNIILMIGDGMGLTQISAGMYANGNTLHLERFPVVGLHKPYSSDNLITDSAAGATAFASGVKTFNGAVGVGPDNNPVPTILEEAEQKGWATGLVATSTITHATPAAFIAHVESRKMMEAIAGYFLQTEIDLFIGGGKKYFTQREDGRDLLAELAQKNYVINDFSAVALPEIPIDFTKNFVYITSEGEPATADDGRDYFLPATKLAPVFLEKKSEKGFFLMIEGSQIDWGGHSKDSDYIISEMIDFDRAIGVVLDYAKENGETLVIVTADHETGGYAINSGSTMDSIVGAFTSEYHTATLIPVFAYGPGAEIFGGIYQNTAVYDKMRKALGW